MYQHRLKRLVSLPLKTVYAYNYFDTLTSSIHCSYDCLLGSKDPIARKMRLRRRRDQEEADQDQAKILKVYFILFHVEQDMRFTLKFLFLT